MTPISPSTLSSWFGSTTSAPPAPTASLAPSSAGASLGLAQTAVGIAADAGVVATLGGSAPVLTYNAAGLLNSLVQAGSMSATMLTGVSGSTAPTPAANLNADWSSVLQGAPGMTGTVVADIVDQGIVGSLSALA